MVETSQKVIRMECERFIARSACFCSPSAVSSIGWSKMVSLSSTPGASRLAAGRVRRLVPSHAPPHSLASVLRRRCRSASYISHIASSSIYAIALEHIPPRTEFAWCFRFGNMSGHANCRHARGSSPSDAIRRFIAEAIIR